MSLLKRLERASKVPIDSKYYPISPIILDPESHEKWRKNLVVSGTKEDIERYERLMRTAKIREKLNISHHGT